MSTGLGYDLASIPRLLKYKTTFRKYNRRNYTTTNLWYKVYKKNKKKACLIFEDQTYTFQDVEDLSNQMSNFLIAKGLKQGDTAALFMENRPEFVTSWLGMTKAGIKVAMINTSIKKKGLLHCIKISEAKLLVYDSELEERVAEIVEELDEAGVTRYCDDTQKEIQKFGKEKVDKLRRAGEKFGSTFGYIYTSGTTGLPKAAIIMHQKMFGFGMFMSVAFKVKRKDVVYTCLPLFHSAGGGLGIGMMLSIGCTVVIRKKFSKSNFFSDCAKYGCTVAQYIGELCRYLLLTPPSAADTQHKLRICIGNGLRPEIWKDFQTRFNIPQIGEFYGSTEGSMALFNWCKKPRDQGYCGRYGPLLTRILSLKIVKFDVENEVPVRNKKGRCIRCKPGEPGELLFAIKKRDPSTKFAGYSNSEATNKKIMRDVFSKNDCYFRTGDLVTQDSKGYFKFVDRIGDTFRWKGENCSTTEVTEAMATYPGIEEVNIYGVQIPNNMDGRAPTAGLTPIDGNIQNVDLTKLYTHMLDELPPYAIPLFIRILPKMEVTATMKHQKVQLREEGIDLERIVDDMYWLNPESKIYEPFTQKMLKKISNGKIKL